MIYFILLSMLAIINIAAAAFIILSADEHGLFLSVKDTKKFFKSKKAFLFVLAFPFGYLLLVPIFLLGSIIALLYYFYKD